MSAAPGAASSGSTAPANQFLLLRAKNKRKLLIGEALKNAQEKGMCTLTFRDEAIVGVSITPEQHTEFIKLLNLETSGKSGDTLRDTVTLALKWIGLVPAQYKSKKPNPKHFDWKSCTEWVYNEEVQAEARNSREQQLLKLAQMDPDVTKARNRVNTAKRRFAQYVESADSTKADLDAAEAMVRRALEEQKAVENAVKEQTTLEAQAGEALLLLSQGGGSGGC